MLITTRVQRHIVLSHKAEDTGEFVFVCCRYGFQEVLGRRVKTGEVITAEVDIKEVSVEPSP